MHNSRIIVMLVRLRAGKCALSRLQFSHQRMCWWKYESTIPFKMNCIRHYFRFCGAKVVTRVGPLRSGLVRIVIGSEVGAGYCH